MIPVADRWGPFAPNIDQAEQRARLRSLRALARVYAGPRAADACRLLAEALSALAEGAKGLMLSAQSSAPAPSLEEALSGVYCYNVDLNNLSRDVATQQDPS